MKRKVLSSLLALSLLWSVSPAAHAQIGNPTPPSPATNAQDWQQLSTLKPGTEILIEFKGGLRDPFKAKFSSAYDDELLVRQDGSPIIFKQRDIQRVYSLKGKWSRSTAAKIGGGVGMIVGTLIGAKISNDLSARPGHIASDADSAPAFAGFFIGSAAGAGVGALLGGKRKGKLLYEAK